MKKTFFLIALIGVGVFGEPVRAEVSTEPTTLTSPTTTLVQQYHGWISTGIAQLNQNDLIGAMNHFKQALAESPGSGVALYYIGVTHARAGQLDEAEKSFKEVILQDPSFISAHFDLGILYYRQNKNDQALQAFDFVQRIDPDRARVYYYQGLILRRMGKQQEAAAKMERAATLDPTLLPEATYNAGLSYFDLGERDRARKAFQTVAVLQPEGELAQSANDYLRQMDQQEKAQRRGELFFSTGLQYDDNVILKPDPFIPLFLQGVQEDSLLSLLFFQGRYPWINTPIWTGQAEYSIYQNLHLDDLLSEFNIQSHNLLINGGRRHGIAEILFQYEAALTLLRRSRYLLQQNVGPRLVLKKTGKRTTEFLYQWGSKDFYNIEPFFPNNSKRDVQTQIAGLNTDVIFRSKGNLHMGYHFIREIAGSSPDEDDWTFDGHRFSAGIVFPVRDKITLAVDTDYVLRRFHARNEQPPGDARKDHEGLVIVTLSRALTPHVDLALQSLHQQNRSNIPLFEYTRNMYGGIVTVRFPPRRGKGDGSRF